MSKEKNKSNFISDNPNVREFLGFTPEENAERDRQNAERRQKSEDRREHNERRVARQRKTAARVGAGLLVSGAVLAGANGLIDEAGDQKKADQYAEEMKNKNIQNNPDLFEGVPTSIEVNNLDPAEGTPVEVHQRSSDN